MVYRGENILRGFDDDVREHLRNEMSGRGIDVICGQTVTAVEQRRRRHVVHLSDGSTVDVDKVMFATGRRPEYHGAGP